MNQVRTIPLLALLGGCAWLSGDDLAAYADADGDGEPALAFGGDDCFPDDAARIGLRCHLDDDGDGYGDPDVVDDSACACAAGWVEDATDCDDGDAGRSPETVWYLDQDGDGLGRVQVAVTCEAPAGTASVAGDCDDGDAEVGDHLWVDADGDGFGREAAAGCTGASRSGDCDDTLAWLHPETRWYVDDDGDTYGIGAPVGDPGCTPPGSAFAPRPDDCDDTDANVFPGVHAFFDGDQDGVGDVDLGEACSGIPAGPETVYVGGDCDDTDPWFGDASYPAADDGDGDGFADASSAALGDCTGIPGDDCVDDDPLRHPGAEWFPDVDRDGFGAPATPLVSCDTPSSGDPYESFAPGPRLDCDDGDATIAPGLTEVPGDNVDQDCDGFALPPPCSPLLLVHDQNRPAGPTTLATELETLPANACVGFVLAPGTFGPVTIPAGVAGVVLVGDPFGGTVFDGTATPGTPAIDVGADALTVEGVAFTRWDEGVLRPQGATREVALRGVDIERSGPVFPDPTLVGAPDLALDTLRLRDVRLADGEGVARVLAAQTLDVDGLAFDGAISGASLLSVYDVGAGSAVRGLTVRRSATAGRFLSLTSQFLADVTVSDVDVRGSLSSGGIAAQIDGPATFDRVRIEECALSTDSALALSVASRDDVTLTDVAVVRNTIEGLIVTDAPWVSTTSGGDTTVSGVEVVGNDDRTGCIGVSVQRMEASAGSVTLSGVAVHGAVGTGLSFADAGRVDLDHVTVAGYASAPAALDVVDHLAPDLTTIVATDSVFVTDDLPAELTATRSTVLAPDARTDPDWPEFVSWAPFLAPELVDLRTVRACPVNAALCGEVDPHPDRGAYALATEVCAPGAWAPVDDCDDDGLFDDWELRIAGTVDARADSDVDGDGLVDADEFALGTVPTESDSDGDGASDAVDAEPMNPLVG